MKAKYGPIAQIGMVTDDLDASIARWIDTMGVGPWTVFRNVTLTGQFRGRDTLIRMDVGLAYQGDTQIELIHVTNGAASPYLAPDGTALLGMHHVAWLTDDLDALLVNALADGLQIAFRAESPGTRVAYLEMPGETGVFFEFIESAQTRQLIADGIAATKNWNGSDPVQIIDFDRL
ncbi:VOC family protein [Croceicoccus sp. F390]|uniref:VOC family protein n=1 Tax=Croceicoccus esteveae TaxID=3075597 RepID=A0ABU2ZKE2_9SPHN|nr:VOC family protein [Croceicoccus sp. F390]MDT0577078.1 VOC family protein [Croceicoccus sp. F390]